MRHILLDDACDQRLCQRFVVEAVQISAQMLDNGLARLRVNREHLIDEPFADSGLRESLLQ